MEDYWFSPKNLEKSRVEYESADPASLLNGGDFASYAKVNRGVGLVGSEIEHHNLVNPRSRVFSYKQIVGSRSKIADLGSGLGFTSRALADIFSAEVDGYEVSLDAVQFSKKTWPDLCFFCRPIEPGVPLEKMYDLIVAQEFYPFTRTADLGVHLGYIESLLRSLCDGGVLLIGLSEGTNESILSNILKLQDEPPIKNTSISFRRLPFDKIYQKIPSFVAAKFLSSVLSFVMKKPRFCVVVIRRI